MKSILIFLKTGHIFKFKGRYTHTDLEDKDLTFYEDEEGNLFHVYKSNVAILVEGESVDKYMPAELSTILNSQIDPREMN